MQFYGGLKVVSGPKAEVKCGGESIFFLVEQAQVEKKLDAKWPHMRLHVV